DDLVTGVQTCALPIYGWRERSLPTTGGDPWHRTEYGDRNLRRDRQRSSFQKGIVPGEYTTGGKQKLLGISKRGNSYLRRLFVQGYALALIYKRTLNELLSLYGDSVSGVFEPSGFVPSISMMRSLAENQLERIASL